jgi:aminopeptidase N
MGITFLFVLLSLTTAQAQVTHYKLKLTPDLDQHLLHGQETIEFHHNTGNVEWQKQPGLQISSIRSADGQAALNDEAVRVRLRTSGKHLLHFEYTAVPHRGITWFTDQAGLASAFYCEAWMVCDIAPAQRATLTLEIVLPTSSGLKAVGPGRLNKHWRDKQGEHFMFEQSTPIQTYLFSFGVAKLSRSVDGRFDLYAPDGGVHRAALTRTAEAYAFLRRKAGVDLADSRYAQAFLPLAIGQEAGGLALLSDRYLLRLERENEVGEMTHELAHQWWGVLVGIASWSDFWLNEGMADFVKDAYLEQYKGRAAYDQEIAAAKERLEKLRREGKDRPLHWEGWKDAHEALGQIPYVKGALFLDRLRTELGEDKFWRGIALYTSRNARRLVDSQDFERAMEEASGQDLQALFDEAVYH